MKDETKPPREAGSFDQAAPFQTPDKRRGGWRTVGVFTAGAAVGAAVAIAAADTRSWRPLVDQAATWAAAHGYQALTSMLEASPPPHGEWASFSPAEQRAVALAYGYDGPVRDGLFARWLEARPDKKAEFAERYLPKPPPAAVRAPERAPERGEWASFTPAEQRAVALAYGYDGPVRDGLFARWLEARPDKKAEFAERYLPKPPPATPASPAIPAPSQAIAPASPPTKPAQKPALSPAPAPASKIEARPAKPAIGDAHYTVRVGSFLDRANAEATATRLSRAGHKVYASDWTDAKGRTWRVVRVGDYASAAEAQRAAAALERLGVSGQPTRLK